MRRDRTNHEWGHLFTAVSEFDIDLDEVEVDQPNVILQSLVSILMSIWVTRKIFLIYDKIMFQVHSSTFVTFYKMVNKQSHVNESNIVVKWLYMIFSTNKVTQLLIRKFFISKYEFRWDPNLNKKILTWLELKK